MKTELQIWLHFNNLLILSYFYYGNRSSLKSPLFKSCKVRSLMYSYSIVLGVNFAAGRWAIVTSYNITLSFTRIISNAWTTAFEMRERRGDKWFIPQTTKNCSWCYTVSYRLRRYCFASLLTLREKSIWICIFHFFILTRRINESRRRESLQFINK